MGWLNGVIVKLNTRNLSTDGIMVSVRYICGFDPQSGPIEDYQFGICYFSVSKEHQ